MPLVPNLCKLTRLLGYLTVEVLLFQSEARLIGDKFCKVRYGQSKAQK